jgi:hypothetical protein
VFKVELEEKGSLVGSGEINISPVIEEVCARNSLIEEVPREIRLLGCEAILEILVRPNLKGKCDNSFSRPIHQHKPPMHASPPTVRPNIPRGRARNETDADESELEEGTRYSKSKAKNRSSSMISIKKPSCRDSSQDPNSSIRSSATPIRKLVQTPMSGRGKPMLVTNENYYSVMMTSTTSKKRPAALGDWLSSSNTS